MTKSHMIRSTAIALVLTLPGTTAFGQDAPECGADAGLPCTIGGELVTQEIADALPGCGRDGVFPCLTGEGDVLAEASEEAPAEAETEAESEAAESEPEEAPAEASTEEAGADDGAAEAEAAEADQPAEAEQPVETEEAEAEQPAEAEAMTEEAAETSEAAESPEEEMAEDAEQPAEEQTEEMSEAPEETPDATADAESAEAEGSEEATEEVATDDAMEAEEEAQEAAEGAEADGAETDSTEMSESSEETTEQGTEESDAVAEAEEETVIEDEAPTATAAAASEEGEATTEEDVVVEEETVTEDAARASSEEFETDVGEESEASAATANAKKDDDDDDGLSKFEKALLLGLGAVAVGQILDNGDEIVSNSGDRVVVQRNGQFRVLKDDDALLRQPGNEVRTEQFSDGSTRTTVTQPDGRTIVTIRSADGRVLRRVRVFEDGTQIVLFDDTEVAEPVDVSELPDREAETIRIGEGDEDTLRAALEAALARDVGRRFSLRQVRDIREVRELAPEIEVDAITFETGSSAIRPGQAEELADLGVALRNLIEERPGEVFLVEGHTDAVGSAIYNLSLSDRRAETVALALTEYFEVPPENLVVQGYGESALKVRTEAAEEANRRATVRRITPLLGRQVASGN